MVDTKAALTIGSVAPPPQQTSLSDNPPLVTKKADDLTAAAGDTLNTKTRALNLTPDMARHLLTGLPTPIAKPLTTLDLRAATPTLSQPYIVRSSDPTETLWGTATFEPTADPAKLTVNMRWTEFDPLADINSKPTTTHVPHRTATLDGVANRQSDGSWHIQLPLPIPRNWNKRDTRDLPLTTNDGNKWSFDSIFYGRATLEPSNWPKMLTEVDAAEMFALTGTTSDGTLTAIPKNNFFLGDGIVRGDERLKDKIVNWLNSGDRRILNATVSGPVDFTPYSGTLKITEKGETHEAKFMYMEPKGDGPHPLIIVNPILTGSYEFEELQMRYLAARGFATVLVHRPDGQNWFVRSKDLSELDSVLRRTVVDQRYVIEHLLETRPTLDASRVGASGFCTGGTNALLLKSAGGRIGPTYAIISSGNLAKAVPAAGAGETRDFVKRNIVEMKERLAKLLGFPVNSKELESLDSVFRETLDAEFSRQVPTDPLRFAEVLKKYGQNSPVGKQIGMVITGGDTYVPTGVQRDVWLALGQPDLDLYRNTDHFELALYWFGVMKKQHEFFDKQFGMTHE